MGSLKVKVAITSVFCHQLTHAVLSFKAYCHSHSIGFFVSPGSNYYTPSNSLEVQKRLSSITMTEKAIKVVFFPFNLAFHIKVITLH